MDKEITPQPSTPAPQGDWREEIPITITEFDNENGIIKVQTKSGQGLDDSVYTIRLFRETPPTP